MRDIEDSFEEKYNKLRGLALKLKKKVTEQNAVIAKLEAENTKAPEPGNLKIQNLKALQVENDKLMDQIDKMKAEISSLTKTENLLKEELEKSAGENSVLKATCDDAKNLDRTVQDTLKQNQTLTKEMEKIQSTKKKLEEEIKKLKGTMPVFFYYIVYTYNLRSY